METESTKKLKHIIYNKTASLSVFGCFEMTIGTKEKERVDYITCDTNNIIRCYEIKISFNDFMSHNKNSFFGHYNYYVITKELYEKIKNDIPTFVGVYVEDTLVKKAKKQKPLYDVDLIKTCMLRSLSRDLNKLYQEDDELAMLARQEHEKRVMRTYDRMRKEYNTLLTFIYNSYGFEWQKHYMLFMDKYNQKEILKLQKKIEEKARLNYSEEKKREFPNESLDERDLRTLQYKTIFR